MKRLFSLMCCLAISSLTLQAASAQATATKPSADEVIAKAIKASTGGKGFGDIKSLVATGEMSIPQVGIAGKMKVSQTADGKGLIEISLPGVGDQKMGSDGETYWEFSQVTGGNILEGDRAEQIKLQIQIGALEKYKEYFDSVECTGEEEFEGMKCYVIVSKKEGSDPMTDYFAVDSGLHVGSKIKAATPMGKLEVVSVMSDYKDVDGFKMSHKTVGKLPNGMTQEVKITSYKINGKIDDKTFDLPDEIKALKK